MLFIHLFGLPHISFIAFLYSVVGWGDGLESGRIFVNIIDCCSKCRRYVCNCWQSALIQFTTFHSNVFKHLTTGRISYFFVHYCSLFIAISTEGVGRGGTFLFKSENIKANCCNVSCGLIGRLI